jgi:DNA-binding HxlR family transcriptional regulator
VTTPTKNAKIIHALGTTTACLVPDAPQEGSATCPLRDILDQVGDKWSVLVVVLLKDGKLRFSDLRRSIDGISQRMLTHTLRQLERDGLASRTVYPSVPLRVEYELTALGRTLIGPLSTLAEWAESHRGAILSARAAYDKAADLESGALP